MVTTRYRLSKPAKAVEVTFALRQYDYKYGLSDEFSTTATYVIVEHDEADADRVDQIVRSRDARARRED